MRWLMFIILTAGVLTLQSAVAPRLEIFGVRPDWLLVIVVFFSLYAPPQDAILGGWLIGILADLMTIERLGLLALSYALAAALVTATRDGLFRYRAVTQFFVVLSVCLIVRFGWLIFRRMMYWSTAPWPVELLTDCLLASLYTAAWAPLLYAVLLPRSRWFGIRRRRYTYGELSRMGPTGV